MSSFERIMPTFHDYGHVFHHTIDDFENQLNRNLSLVLGESP